MGSGSEANVSVRSMAESQDASEVVKLQSSEGKMFEVPLEVAKVSRTLSIMLEDLGHHPDDIIPLPNVNSGILKRVIAWAEHSVQEGLDGRNADQIRFPTTSTTTTTINTNSTTVTTNLLNSPTRQTPPTSNQVPFQPRPHPHVPHRLMSRRILPPPSHALSPWEKDFLTRNKEKIYDLLLAANYLDIKSLLDVLCRVIADIIKGRDPQDIRRAFHVSDSAQLGCETTPTSPSLLPSSVPTSSPLDTTSECSPTDVRPSERL